jgi:hypothetical protein
MKLYNFDDSDDSCEWEFSHKSETSLEFDWLFLRLYEGVSKSLRTESITK